jgi:DNA-binding NtrC family response regulator
VGSRSVIDVLVVDDDEEMRQSAIAVLRLFGYVAEGASNVAQALATLSSEPVRLMLLDVRMPQLSGLVLLDLIPMPFSVILMTGYEHPPLPARHRWSEHATWLDKPFTADQLRRAVETALGDPQAAPAT